MSNFKIISSYHFTINLYTTSMAAENFVKPKKYIGPSCTRSALARQLIWKGILIYRRYIGAGCIRSAVEFLKVFTTTDHTHCTGTTWKIPSQMEEAPQQSVTNIFEYSNILVTNIYSDIRSYQFFFYEYIRTFVRVKFVCTNIFGHSLVSVLECKTSTNIRIHSNIRAIFNTNTYSDIRSCQRN